MIGQVGNLNLNLNPLISRTVTSVRSTQFKAALLLLKAALACYILEIFRMLVNSLK